MIIKKLWNFVNEKNTTNYNNIIDYSFLTELTNDKIKKICDTAKESNVNAVCVLPEYVSIVSSFLKDENIDVVATIDFPKGDSTTNQKMKKIDESLVNGANEIDVVVNYKLIKSKKIEKLTEEIREITEHIHKEGKIVKVVAEIGALNFQELEKFCEICIDANVDFIMTSTGKLPNDNSFDEKIEKLNYIRKILPADTKIKFSGGIRTNKQIEEISNIVDRIGTSVIPV
jgi:deoxyribose-phosphate aldolase